MNKWQMDEHSGSNSDDEEASVSSRFNKLRWKQTKLQEVEELNEI